MKKYRLLLLGLIVMGTFLSSFHYHSDGLSHSECQACIVQSNLDSAGDVQSYSLTLIDTKIDLFIPFYKNLHERSFYSNTRSRAPPSFS